MYRARPAEDPARRWRGFCRGGLRMAGGAAAVWFVALALLLRVAPMPDPLARAEAPRMSWWPGPRGDAFEARSAADIRALWSPAAFALPTPLGFSHPLRRERARLAPPVQVRRSPPAYGDSLPPSAMAWGENPVRRWDVAAVGSVGIPSASAVFPPKAPEPDQPRMAFPEGWESRLFSGIDLDFSAWTNAPWSARIEMRFDGKGVPVSMLLARSTGLPDVDQRLARSANGWRLLDAQAPRTGVVAWNSPGAPAVPEREAP